MNAPDLRAELASAAEDFDTLRRMFSQIGAVLACVEDNPRSTELIELAQYTADDWADSAATMGERVARIASNARGNGDP